MNLVTLDNDNKLTSADVYDANSKQSQADINARLIDVSTGNKFQFGIDANGNYGYIKEGADSVTPFKKVTYGFAHHVTQGGYCNSLPKAVSNMGISSDGTLLVIQEAGDYFLAACGYGTSLIINVYKNGILIASPGWDAQGWYSTILSLSVGDTFYTTTTHANTEEWLCVELLLIKV